MGEGKHHKQKAPELLCHFAQVCFRSSRHATYISMMALHYITNRGSLVRFACGHRCAWIVMKNLDS